MQPTYLLPLLSLLPAILASPIVPIDPEASVNVTSLAARSPLGELPKDDRGVWKYLGGGHNSATTECYFHTQVVQKCEGGELYSYVYMSRPNNAQDTFHYFDFRPTFGVPNIRYVEGKTQKGPRIWKKFKKSYFESTWFGDHMWYSYNGNNWSDNDIKQCLKGDWTAGPLTCDKPGTLEWRTYDTDCAFQCVWS